MRSLFLSPHNDDAVLFGFYTICAERPRVVTVFDSYVQACTEPLVTAKVRRAEDVNALECAGLVVDDIEFLGLRDDMVASRLFEEVLVALRSSVGTEYFDRIYAPMEYLRGHVQHNAVGMAARTLWPGRVKNYHTYIRGEGKYRAGLEVTPQDPRFIVWKHAALACYRSQILYPKLGCQSWFTEDLREYVRVD